MFFGNFLESFDDRLLLFDGASRSSRGAVRRVGKICHIGVCPDQFQGRSAISTLIVDELVVKYPSEPWRELANAGQLILTSEKLDQYVLY